MSGRKPVPAVVILGPTAAGKTKISLWLAERLNGEIVSADSRLFYRGMDIGTAKPSMQDRSRVPHHLIDVTPPDRAWTLAKFQREALKALEDIHRRGRLPFIVGGTGQYLTALIEGWRPPPRAASPALREQLEALAKQRGAVELHRRLAAIDPASAERIDYRNVRRVVRALEIFQVTGLPPSQVRIKKAPPLECLRVGLSLPRAELYRRIDDRIRKMLDKGLVEEVRNLLAQGYPPDLPAFSAIGYRQIIQHIQGHSTLEEAITEVRRLTRQFVRRQANWFPADDPHIHWFPARPGVERAIISLIRSWFADAA